MSLVSQSTAELASLMSARRWKGKFDDVTVLFGPPNWNEPSPPGLSVFLTRASAPAWKWQVAQACTPSLPTCMSQNSALPRVMAALRSLTKEASAAGSGGFSVLSD